MVAEIRNIVPVYWPCNATWWRSSISVAEMRNFTLSGAAAMGSAWRSPATVTEIRNGSTWTRNLSSSQVAVTGDGDRDSQLVGRGGQPDADPRERSPTTVIEIRNFAEVILGGLIVTWRSQATVIEIRNVNDQIPSAA